MRILLLALALFAFGAEAQPLTPVQYGVAKTIPGLALFDNDGLPLTGEAASSVTLRCDGGSAGAATNSLSELGTSGVYRLALTAGETACADVTIHIASTPAHNFTLTTFGSHAAYDSTGVVRGGLAQDGAATSITLDSGASTDPLDYVGQLVELIDGTGSSPPQTRLITQYSGSTTKVADVNRAWVTNPASGTRFVIHSSEVAELEVVDGKAQVDVASVGATGREDIRTAVGRATANADTQHAAIAADTGTLMTGVNVTEWKGVAVADASTGCTGGACIRASMSQTLQGVITGTTLNDSATDKIRDAMLNFVIEDEGGITLRCKWRADLAALWGDWIQAGNDVTFRDPSGAAVRGTGTVDPDGLARNNVSIVCP